MRLSMLWCLPLILLLVGCGGGGEDDDFFTIKDPPESGDDSGGDDQDDGTAPPEDPVPPPEDPDPPPEDGLSDFARQMLNALNAERSAQGREPLTWSDRLANAAVRHCNDMSRNNHFSHTGTDGSTVGDRARDAGYDWNTVGENIAQGQRSIDQVMDDWMNSPGHRENILRDEFTQVGAAEVSFYWTQVFGRPSGVQQHALIVDQ